MLGHFDSNFMFVHVLYLCLVNSPIVWIFNTNKSSLSLSYPLETDFRPSSNTIEPALTLAMTVTYDIIAMLLVLARISVTTDI